MKEFDEDYLNRIRSIIERRDDAEARRELADLHPADIAELYQDLNLDEAEYLYKLLDEETAANVIMELDEDDRRKLLKENTELTTSILMDDYRLGPVCDESFDLFYIARK